jgi:hypothetical protein
MRLNKGYAMSNPNFLPWWKKQADQQAEEAARQFYGTVQGSFPGSNIVLSIIASYVGERFANRNGSKK